MEYQDFERFQEYDDLHATAEQVTAQGSAGGGHCPRPTMPHRGLRYMPRLAPGLLSDCSRQRAATQGRLRECAAAGLPAIGAARAHGAAAAQAAADMRAAAAALHPAARRGARARASGRDGAQRERTCLPAGRRAGAGARRAGLANAALARCERAWRRHAAWPARAHAAW